jgi:hypothetical protein
VYAWIGNRSAKSGDTRIIIASTLRADVIGLVLARGLESLRRHISVESGKDLRTIIYLL